MDGLHEMTAAGVPVEIGSQTYYLCPLRAKDWAEAARVLLARQRSPLALVKEHLAGLSEPHARHLLELAWQEERQGELIPSEQVERWFAQPEGRVYEFWLMVRQAHPQITLDAAEQILRQATCQQLAGLAAQERTHRGLPLGNSTGQAQATRPLADDGARSPGAASSAS